MPAILSLIGKGNVFHCRNDKFVHDSKLLLTSFSRYHPHLHIIMLVFIISTDYVASNSDLVL